MGQRTRGFSDKSLQCIESPGLELWVTRWEFLTSFLSYLLFLHLANIVRASLVAGIGLGPGYSWKSNGKQTQLAIMGLRA